MRRVKKACVSSSVIPSRWSTQPSRVTLMLKVRSPTRRVYVMRSPLSVTAARLAIEIDSRSECKLDVGERVSMTMQTSPRWPIGTTGALWLALSLIIGHYLAMFGVGGVLAIALGIHDRREIWQAPPAAF